MYTSINLYPEELTLRTISSINERADQKTCSTQTIADAIKNNAMKIIWAIDENRDRLILGYAAYRPDARDLRSFQGRKNNKPKVYLSSIATTPQGKEKGAETALLKKVMNVGQGRLYLHHHGSTWYKDFANSEGLDWREKSCGTYMDGSPKVEMKLSNPHLKYFQIQPNTYSHPDTIGTISQISRTIPGSELDTQTIESAITRNAMQIFWALDKKGDAIGFAAIRPDARDLRSFQGRKNKKPKVYLSHLVTTLQTKEQGAVTALLKKAMEVAEDRLYLHCHDMTQYKNFAESEDLDWIGRDCGRYMDGSPKIEMKLTKPHLASTLDFFETKPNTYSHDDTIDIIEKIHGNAPISNRDIQSLAEAIKHNTMQIFWALDKNGDVIGYAAYRPDARDLPSFQGGKNKKPKVYLSYLTVTPEARSNGVGSALLSNVLEVAQGRLYLHPAGKAWYEIFAEKYDVAFIEKNCGTYSDGSPKIVMKLEARDAEL